MKNKLYQVIIGLLTVSTTPAVPGVPAAGETPAIDAIPERTDTSYNPNTETLTVVAADVEEAVAKLKPTLKENQHIESVERIRDIDVA